MKTKQNSKCDIGIKKVDEFAWDGCCTEGDKIAKLILRIDEVIETQNEIIDYLNSQI
jgi:hypothetical protein